MKTFVRGFFLSSLVSTFMLLAAVSGHAETLGTGRGSTTFLDGDVEMSRFANEGCQVEIHQARGRIWVYSQNVASASHHAPEYIDIPVRKGRAIDLKNRNYIVDLTSNDDCINPGDGMKFVRGRQWLMIDGDDPTKAFYELTSSVLYSNGRHSVIKTLKRRCDLSVK